MSCADAMEWYVLMSSCALLQRCMYLRRLQGAMVANLMSVFEWDSMLSLMNCSSCMTCCLRDMYVTDPYGRLQ